MTAEEAYNHKWKEGEIIYGILREYSGGDLKLSQWYKGDISKVSTGMVDYPIKVIPLKVVKIDSSEYGPFATGYDEFLFIDFEETHKSVFGDFKIGVNINRDKNRKIKKICPNFDKSHLECKFFTKEEAEAYIPIMKKNIKKKYTSCIKWYMNHIENLKCQIKSSEEYINKMQESLDKID